MNNKKLYDNIALLSNKDDFLGYISKKKTNWYLNKNLAELINENTCKLNFEGNFKDGFIPSTIFKQINNCVLCNSSLNLTKFSLIHKDVKKMLSEEYSSHRSHAILPICIKCRCDADSFMSDELKETINLNNSKDYIDNIKLYANQINSNNIEPYELEKIWANKFYEILEPLYLPDGWLEFFKIN